MEWITTVFDSWMITAIWMAGLAAILGVLAGLMPCNSGMFWWKDLRAVATDSMYWFVAPLVMRVCRMWMLMAGLALLLGGKQAGLFPIGDMPIWQQCAAMLLLQEVMLYWIHRGFHTRLAWKFHAIHHSPTVLDWMSTGRNHPVNNLLAYALADTAVLLLGFSQTAFVWLTAFNLVYSSMVHANLNWTFGPLRFIFASPVFHRWHHTTEAEGLNKNFAPTLPLLDVMFGTFYMPHGILPIEFGTGEPDFPETFWGQLLHPFKKNTSPSLPVKLPAGRRPKKRAA